MKLKSKGSSLCACCCCSCESNTESDDLPIDKGWAWVIIFASAGIFGIIAGTFKVFGIIKLKMLEAYPECSQETSMWILSLASAVSLMFGPLVSLLLTKFSSRTVGLIGSIVSCTGLLITSVAPNCNFLFFSFSIVYATGGGTVVVVCFTSFAPYFLKHRALAVGIMASGSGLGGVILPPLVTYLFENFPFRDALILYCGVCLHTIVFASLLRPFSYYERLSRHKRSKITTVEHKSAEPVIVPTILVDEGSSTSSSQKLTDSTDEFRARSKSHTGRGSIKLVETEPTIYSSLPFSLDKVADQQDNHNNNKRLLDKTELLGSAVSLSAVPTVETTKYIHSSCQYGSKAKENNSTTTEYKQQVASQKAKYDWKTWVNPKVILLCMIMFFAMNANCLFHMTTPSFADEYGVSLEQLSTLMAVTGACEIPCRVINGFIADRKFTSAMTQLAAVLFASGVAGFLTVLLPGYVGLCIIYSTIALVGSSMFSLLPIVYIELMGVDHLAAVTGICNVYQAVAFLASASIANVLHAAFDSWLYVMVYLSACYGLSALIGLIYSIMNYLRMRRQIPDSVT